MVEDVRTRRGQPSMGATRILQLSVVALMVEGFRGPPRRCVSPVCAEFLTSSTPLRLPGVLLLAPVVGRNMAPQYHHGLFP